MKLLSPIEKVTPLVEEKTPTPINIDGSETIPLPPINTAPKVEEFSYDEAIGKLKAKQKKSLSIQISLIFIFSSITLLFLLSYFTQMKITWLILPLGIGLGLVIRKYGKGVSSFFGLLSALSTITIACVSHTLYYINHNGTLEISNKPTSIAQNIYEILFFNITSVDVVFFGLAIYFSYTFALRKLTQDDLRA